MRRILGCFSVDALQLWIYFTLRPSGDAVPFAGMLEYDVKGDLTGVGKVGFT